MADWGFPPNVFPIQSWRMRPGSDVRHWAPYLPEVTITVATDDLSSGLTIHAWTATLGEFAEYRTIYAKRWLDKPQSLQEALEVASRGIIAALAALFPGSTE
jgi:hypothetical protein